MMPPTPDKETMSSAASADAFAGNVPLRGLYSLRALPSQSRRSSYRFDAGSALSLTRTAGPIHHDADPAGARQVRIGLQAIGLTQIPTTCGQLAAVDVFRMPWFASGVDERRRSTPARPGV